MSQATLLVCTVGGSPQPVAAAIRGSQPARVIFVVSPETRGDVEERILPLLRQEGMNLSPGQYDVVQIPDAQDSTACVEKMRELGSEVEKWVQRGEGYHAIADFTGGTKCMSAALALVARRWLCHFSYVGGRAGTRAA